MDAGSHTSKRNSWELQLTQAELEQLRRERNHLRSKALERNLTPWEQLRQREIFQEATALLKRARALGSSVTRLVQ